MKKNTEKYNMDQSLYSGVFAFPTKIVDQYLKLASDAALKVILCLTRHSGIDIDIDLITVDTGLSPSQIKDSFLFWEQVGVLKKGESDFVFENKVYQTPDDIKVEEPKKEIPPEKKEEKTTPKIENIEENIKSTPRVITISNSPRYPTPKEAAKWLKESEEVKFLVKKSEEVLERPLNSSALASLVMLFDWADIPSDIILMVVHYCKGIGIRDIRRIEKTALEFKDLGINTHEKADEYIKSRSKYHTFEASVKRILGIGQRNLSKNESGYMETWHQSFNSPLELIEEAFNKSVQYTGEISLPYMNTVLNDWHEKGVTTKEEVENLDKEFLLKNTPTDNKKRSKNKSPATYDIDDAEKSDMFRVPKL